MNTSEAGSLNPPLAAPLSDSVTLVTGIADEGSLALAIARQVQREGGRVVCCGLGRTPHHENLSARSTAYLERSYADFSRAAEKTCGPGAVRLAMDVTVDESIADVARALRRQGIELSGVVHAIAMDKTIRDGAVKPMLDVSREEFFGAMDVSAYSLIALTRALLNEGVLRRGSSIVALSYLGAERVMRHPYKNIGAAKAALERIAMELAYELGKAHSIRVNVVRFSPYAESKAGGAIAGLVEAAARADEDSPLGNARPQDLAAEVAYLLRPEGRVTAEIRHVDGGQHIR